MNAKANVQSSSHILAFDPLKAYLLFFQHENNINFKKGCEPGMTLCPLTALTHPGSRHSERTSLF